MYNQLRHGRVTTDEVSPQSPEKNHCKTDKGAAKAQLPHNNPETDQRAAGTELPDQGAPEAELPQDIITEILLCFPVKSLLRFRCVSKALCTIIDSEQFIYLHLNGYAENKKQRKLIIQENPIIPRIRKERQLARSLHVYDVDTGVQDKIKKPYLRSALPYGYCNGLILLFVNSKKLAVWNPTTHQYRNLPRCPIKTPKGSHCSRIGMGLGYDSTRNDYKVVLIVGTKTNNDVHDLHVWIFGLKSNSWRMSSQDFPYRKDKVTYFGHFANGSLYWLCRPRGGEYAVVAFDVAKETISEVSQPLSPTEIKCYRRDLHVLDGCLCMSFFLSTIPKKVSFYVKKEVGTEFQWRKLFSLTPRIPLFFGTTETMRVLGYSKEGDKILLDRGLNVIALYDLKQRCYLTENRNLVDVEPKSLWGYPFLCVESLASVGGGDFLRMSGRKRKHQEP